MSEPNMPEAGTPIQDPKKLGAQELLERLQKATTELIEMKRNYERTLAVEKDKAKVELDRLRGTTANHIRDVEGEARALTRSLSRLQAEADQLRSENIVLRSKLESNGHAEAVQQTPTKAP
jgi:DNA repair exonuclease SbcCD ATPase subunit